MKLMLLAAVLITLAGPLAAAPKDTAAVAAPSAGFDPKRNADADIRQAITDATKANKHILLDVGGNWCKWCRMMEQFFESNPELAHQLHTEYVVVKVNYSKENENKDVLSRYPKVPGYPHFFVLKSDGSLLHSQDTGLLEKGQGYDPVKMKAFLTQWAK